ncbi:MAG: hypothetical protein LBN37_03605 [Bacteroidales bacterium]|nr:hypothetical protein [Bacteroidales bacterium]
MQAHCQVFATTRPDCLFTDDLRAGAHPTCTRMDTLPVCRCAPHPYAGESPTSYAMDTGMAKVVERGSFNSLPPVVNWVVTVSSYGIDTAVVNHRSKIVIRCGGQYIGH